MYLKVLFEKIPYTERKYAPLFFLVGFIFWLQKLLQYNTTYLPSNL